MSDAERKLLIAIAEGLACRLVNAGGTGYQHHVNNLRNTATNVQLEMERGSKDEGR